MINIEQLQARINLLERVNDAYENILLNEGITPDQALSFYNGDLARDYNNESLATPKTLVIVNGYKFTFEKACDCITDHGWSLIRNNCGYTGSASDWRYLKENLENVLHAFTRDHSDKESLCNHPKIKMQLIK